jgi:hypothetical protein
MLLLKFFGGVALVAAAVVAAYLLYRASHPRPAVPPAPSATAVPMFSPQHDENDVAHPRPRE